MVSPPSPELEPFWTKEIEDKLAFNFIYLFWLYIKYTSLLCEESFLFTLSIVHCQGVLSVVLSKSVRVVVSKLLLLFFKYTDDVLL